MNIHDKAHELADILKNCDEYQAFLKAKRNLDRDETAKKMVKDFLEKQMAYEYDRMAGKSDADKERQLQQLSEVLTRNPGTVEFLQAHIRFQRIMADIYKIIGDSIAEGMDIFGK